MGVADKVRPPVPAPKVFAAFDGGSSHSLGRLCRDLVESQKESWPEYRRGCEALEGVQVRHIGCTGFSVRVQHNPGRIRSTMAGTGPGDVSTRPCFLCLPNLPHEQKGILYRNDYLILCNPMPVFPCHFTVSGTEHRTQAVEENIRAFLFLMADLGDEWTALYNGPRCGASAPDHLHFQVIPSGRMPVEEEVGEEGRLEPVAETEGVRVGRLKDMGREIIILEGKDLDAVGRVFNAMVEGLRAALRKEEEPMMSLQGRYAEGRFRLILFPRATHRPRAFYAEGESRISVSPAVIEMGGVLVAPVEADFSRLERRDVEAIYEEVSLDGQAVEAAFRVLSL